MKGFGENKKTRKKSYQRIKPSQKQIINQAIRYHSLGNVSEAANYYKFCINQGFADYRVFLNYGAILQIQGQLQNAELLTRKAIEIKSDFADAHLNLGNILRDQGKLKEAEISTRKAIELKSDYSEAYYNLGNILKNLGKLDESELSYRKAIKIKPDMTKAYFSLSTLQYSNENEIWREKLFSDKILNNKLKNAQVDIYFARANILHKEKNFKSSSKFLKLANNLKFDLNPFNFENYVEKSRILLFESSNKELNTKEPLNNSKNIFIVGMPRCGSTLLESIITMNKYVYDLGEINILEESYIKYKESKNEIRLAEIYNEKVKNKTKLNINTNKWLYNFRYAGIISNQIPDSKIIHCYRNPLDNILSIYRAHFTKGNQYSSSLVDCAKVYLHQEEVMSNYKKKFQSKIYNLNYDLLTSNPKKEIKSLINWLGWEWQDSYLSPHLNNRSIKTRSSVEVRSPINSKSIGGWKNYKEMLKPAIEILIKTDRYKDLIT